MEGENDLEVDPDLNKDDPGANPDDPGKEETPESTPIKIGEKEYKPEELTAYIKKAGDYDALLPEFTKKSQALALLLGGKDPNESQEDTPSFLKEGWKPKDFAELGAALKEAVEWGQKKSEEAIESKGKQTQEAKKAVDDFVVEVKKSDKDFDDEEFFQYIDRHHIKVDTIEDLKSVYSAYSEANSDGKMAERRIALNKTKRATDSVSKPSSSGEEAPYDANKIRTEGLGIVDAAKKAMGKLK